MSNYSADDITRSLQLYVDQALGDAWETFTEREVIADSERPVAVVELSTPVGPMPGAPPDRRAIPQGDVARGASWTVTAYTAIYDTAREGRLEAQRVADLFDDALTFGLVDGSTPPVNIGRPGAVPIFDYAGLPVVGEGRAPTAPPYGWANVGDHSVRPIQDPVDEKRWTVALTLRLTWWRGGRVGPDAPVVTRVGPPTFTPEPSWGWHAEA